MRPLRAVVVGLGAMGRHHVRVASETPGVRLAGVADADRGVREAFSRQAGVPSFACAQDALSASPELAIVAVPTSAHARIAIPFLEAGVHVLVEKPIAATVDDAERLVRTAESHGALLAVGHVERFNPAVSELVSRVRAGEVGRVFHVHARRIGPFPPRIADVGVVVDLATHDLDLFNQLCGADPARVAAEVRHLRGSTHEDLASALVAYPSGIVCVLDVNWLTPTKVRRFCVTGERGILEADLLRQELTLFHPGAAPSGELVPVAREEPLRRQLRDFVDAVQLSRPPAVSGQAGLAALRLAHRLLVSASPAAVPSEPVAMKAPCPITVYLAS